MITNNMGGVDTTIRAILGCLVMVLAAVAADLHPFVAIGTGFVATVVLVTAISGVCPLYTALGINTRSRSRPRAETRRDLAAQLR